MPFRRQYRLPHSRSRRGLIFILLTPMLAVAPSVTGRKTQTEAAESRQSDFRGADLVLLHGKVWTGAPFALPGERPQAVEYAEAVAAIGGRIRAVGRDHEIQAYVGANTRLIDLHGRMAMPGFIDDHVHFMDGSFQLLEVDLKHTRDEAEFTKQIAAKARSLAPGRWILGGDWDEEAWPDAKLPTRSLIDSVTPRNPVFISRYDGHAGLANSLALRLAGIKKDTQDPAGGIIVRDPKTAEPTGVLKDNAQDLVERLIPAPSEADVEEALQAGLAEARRVGVTSVQDMDLGDFATEIRLLRRFEVAGSLTCRFYEFIPLANWKRLAGLGISRDEGDEFIQLGGVKAFADGSLGSRTAWMFEPYVDEPGFTGLTMPAMNPPSKMEQLVRDADRAGIQIAVHAIGTRANAEMLDVYERVAGMNAPAHRFRIEHAQHVRPADFARFGRLGIIASMQPYHAIDDGRWAEKRISHEVARYSFAWRSMLDAGAPLAFGTDWPVAPLNPLLGIYAAVTRETLDGRHPGGWFPEQKLSLDEALRAYTQGSAYAAFQEKDKGTIAPGKLADIIVLSDDLFHIPPDHIKDAHVVMTIMGGRVVYGGKEPSRE